MRIFKGEDDNRRQGMLLPYSVEEFVRRDARVRFLDEIIDQLELQHLRERYQGGGTTAYDPILLLKVLIYAYSEGVHSSRRIAAFLERDTHYMFLAEMQTPSYRTIGRFRSEHEQEFVEVYGRTVLQAVKAGLVSGKEAAADGSKLQANVSGKETFSRERAAKLLAQLETEAKQLLAEADRVDREEDARYGEARGDELPEGLRRVESRLAHLKQVRQEMEEAGLNTYAATDPESRVMKTKEGNRPAYNAQVVVDGAHRVIVAAEVVQSANDHGQLPGLLEQVEQRLGALPQVVLADKGYNDQATLQYLERRGIEAYIPVASSSFIYDAAEDRYSCPGGKGLEFARVRVHGGKVYRVYRGLGCSGCEFRAACGLNKGKAKELWCLEGGETRAVMGARVRSAEGKKMASRRMSLVESVFGYLKEVVGLRRLLLRGLSGARIEFFLGCIVHNVMKLIKVWRTGRAYAAA